MKSINNYNVRRPRRYIAIFMTAIIMATLSNCTFFGIERRSGDFAYTVNSQGHETVVQYIGKGGDVVIPENLGMPTSDIGDKAFQNCIHVTSVTIPGCVGGIGDYAFQNCTGLTSVTWGNFSVGKYAFQNCTALTTCIIFDNTSLDDGAFSGCSGLHAVYFEGDAPSEYQMGKDVFAGTASDFTIYYNPDKEGWSDGWNGYHAVPLPATTTPSAKPNLV